MATHTFSVSEFFYDDSFRDYAVVNALYLDILTSSVGLNFLNPVKLIATQNVETVGFPTIDGVQLSDNDRILLTNQDNSDNGVFVVQENEWQKARHSPVGDVVLSLEGTSAGFVFLKTDTRWCRIIQPLSITPTSWSINHRTEP